MDFQSFATLCLTSCYPGFLFVLIIFTCHLFVPVLLSSDIILSSVSVELFIVPLRFTRLQISRIIRPMLANSEGKHRPITRCSLLLGQQTLCKQPTNTPHKYCYVTLTGSKLTSPVTTCPSGQVLEFPVLLTPPML